MLKKESEKDEDIDITSMQFMLLIVVVGFATKTLNYSIFYMCPPSRFRTHADLLSVQGVLKISAFCNLKKKNTGQEVGALS